MAGFAYAVPAKKAPAPAPLWVATEMIWTGHDGSVWDLTDPDGGVVLMREGVEGLHMPTFTQWTRSGPAVAGQTFTGAIAEPRRVVLPVAVYEDSSSQAWVQRDRAFWKSMHPRKYGTLTVSPAGTGSRRSLQLRFVPEAHVYDNDPAMARWADYTAVLVADQPLWAGTTVRKAFAPPIPQDFYEKTGPQVINLMTGHTTENAAVRNDGDEDAWPVWTVIGPVPTAHMGVGDKVVEVPFNVAAGKAVVIDEDPRMRTAIEYDYTPPTQTMPAILANPVDRTRDLTGAVDWARVPTGDNVPLNVSFTGTGLVQVELTPMYWRAW